MKKSVVLLPIVGAFGLIGSAGAQAPSAVGPSFDGAYRVVSAKRVNQLYTSYNGQSAQCPDRTPESLHIMRGRPHYTTATGYRLRVCRGRRAS